jgi:Zn-dependent M16 (insulinase) family peptidase
MPETETCQPKLADKIPDSLKLTPQEQKDYADKHGIAVETLSNGNALLAANRTMEDRQNTQVEAHFRIGHWHDPSDKLGLAHFAEHMLFQGCAVTPTPREQKIRPSRGGYYLNGHTRAYYTWYEINSTSGLTSPQYGIDYGLDHFFSMLTQPTLSSTTIEKEREVIVDEYERARTSVDNIRRMVVLEKVFPEGHLMLHKGAGNEETIPRIQIEDIRTLIDKYYTPQNCLITAYSQGNPQKHEQIVAGIMKRSLDGFANHHGQLATLPDFDQLAKMRSLKNGDEYREKRENKKGRVWIACAQTLSVERFTPEHYALQMAQKIIKDSVHEALRAEGYGYAPEFRSENIPYTESGVYAISLEVSAGKVDSLVLNIKPLIKKVIMQAIEDEAPKAEIERAKMQRGDAPISLATRFADAEFGLKLYRQITRTEDYFTSQETVKPADVRKWLEYLAENPGALFVVGDITA